MSLLVRLKTFLGRLRKLLPSSSSPDDLTAWRENICYFFFWSALTLGTITYLLSMHLSIRTESWVPILVFTLAYLWAIVVSLIKRIPFKFKATSAIMLCYFVGAIDMVFGGLTGSGRLWLLASSTLSALLLGLESALIMVALCITTMITLGTLMTSGHIPWPQPLPMSVDAWNVFSASFLLICVVMTTSIGLIMRGLDASLSKEKALTLKLTDLNVNLEVEIESRRRIEAALRASEERFRALNENVIDVILTLDKWGRIQYITPSVKNMLGYEVEEVQWKSAWEFIHLEERKLISQRFNRAMEHGLSREATILHLQHKDGHIVCIEALASNQLENPTVRGIVLNIRDITERTESERALRASEERYRSIFENSTLGIFQCDQEGTPTRFNEVFARMFGFKDIREMEKLRGTPAFTAIFNEHCRNIVLTSLAQGADSTKNIFEFHRKDGGSFSGRLIARTIQSPKGDMIGIEGFIEDVSELVRAEKEKKNLEEQLRHAQKMEAIGTLAGGVAHDFNNLLQAIAGYTQLLMLKKEHGHPDLKSLQQIENSCFRAGELTKQLLTFSRKVESKLETLDINKTIVRVCNLLSHTIPKMIRIEVDLKAYNGKIQADPAQIEQILMNLGNNARDAMPHGGVLRIETENVTLDDQFCKSNLDIEPGDYIMLAVSDTGQGMDKSTLQHIYEPFFTTKGLGGGTGLGLSIVYGIVKNHRGCVSCESQMGKGTTFTIYFPADKTETVSKKAPNVVKPAIRGGDETVLIVDDERTIRDLCVTTLTEYGYTVLTACNGEEALEIYKSKNEEIALIILDLSMPGMGGYACLNKLLGLNPTVKVIIASGYADKESTDAMLKTGALDFLPKPFTIGDLLETVRNTLDLKPLRPPLRVDFSKKAVIR